MPGYRRRENHRRWRREVCGIPLGRATGLANRVLRRRRRRYRRTGPDFSCNGLVK